MTTRRSRVGILAAVAVSLCFAGAALGNGGKAKNAVYKAWTSSTGGGIEFRSETSPIIFYLGTVNKKYHVLLIRVINSSQAPLALSKDQDTAELRFGTDTKVKCLLNLPAVDPATWDGLDAEMRTAVAYPRKVAAGEEEGIYLFIPIDTVAGPRKQHVMPSAILYHIKSLPEEVRLVVPIAAA